MDEITVIETDLHCGRCGYNLRTLQLDGKCPECGVPVRRSVLGSALAASSRHWRNSLALGLVCMAVSVGAWVLLQAIVGQGYQPVRLSRYMIILSMVAAVFGVWLLTVREPDPLVLERPWSRRRILRVGLLAEIGFYTISPMFNIRLSLYAQGMMAVKVLVVVTLLAMMVLLWMLGMHVAQLMQRANRKVLKWVWRGTGSLGLAAGIIFLTPIAPWFFAQYDSATAGAATLATILLTMSTVVVVAGLFGYSAWVVWKIGRAGDQP